MFLRPPVRFFVCAAAYGKQKIVCPKGNKIKNCCKRRSNVLKFKLESMIEGNKPYSGV